jgi:hypothetical protein
MFISILYMFRATMCPSSEEITVSIRHLVFVNLCGWPSGMQGRMKNPSLHTRQSSTESDKYQVSYLYSYFSWWWAHSCPKRVEIRNKHTKKEVDTRLILFTRLYKDARSTKHKIKRGVFLIDLLFLQPLLDVPYLDSSEYSRFTDLL